MNYNTNNTIDFYETYNAERYIHFRYVPTGEYELQRVKRGEGFIHLKTPLMEKQKISFDDVKQINLDNYGQDVRTSADDFTLVHNYLLDFWSPVIGSDAISLYIHLKRYCFSGKDFCFPNMDIIQSKMKIKSRATLNKLMKILEEYGFIAKILRMDTERNNGFSSPFFKVRRYVPLLPDELIDLLPEGIREEHDKFLATANGIDYDDTFNSDLFQKDLMKSAEVIKSKTQETKELDLKKKGKFREYIFTQLSPTQQEEHMMILKHLQERVSKPSFDTWIRNSLFLINKDQRTILVLVSNSFCQDWMQTRYKNSIEALVTELWDFAAIHYTCETYENYINANEFM